MSYDEKEPKSKEELDLFARLDRSIVDREKQRMIREEIKRRTFSGFQKTIYVKGSSPEDAEWEAKLRKNQSRINKFYERYPGLGKPKKNQKRRHK